MPVVVGLAMLLPAGSALAANPGYELDAVKPSIALSAEVPHGIAIDQVSQAVYVTELTTNFNSGAHGQIEKFDASGAVAAGSPFVTGGQDFFTGVAVNPVEPVNRSIYAYQTQFSTPLGILGTVQMNTFSSAGVLGTSFNPTKSSGPQIAADSAGRVYYPNDATDTVQVFDSSGALKNTVACTGCTGGAFSNPASVALDSAGNLYVVDLGVGRAIKFKPSAGSFAFDSVLQSGKGAVAVGVDPSTDDVFVGDLGAGGYHVVAYSSSGTQFDDFGAGVIGPPKEGAQTAGQIAANATTHKVYVTDSGANKVWIFDRVASIPAPTATTEAATPVGQLEATLNASVNPKGHGLTECEFEYTDDADFQANGYANAESAPCPFNPGGSSPTLVTATIEGLTPGATYDYRITIANNGGVDEGGDQAFTTLPALAPTATTGAASALTQTTATMAGTVNAHGGPISNCHFEYTNDADFQVNGFSKAISKTCLPKPSGTTNVAVTAKLTGLVAGTTYRFRLLATNNAGPAEGSSQSFVTAADTCATKPSLCPPPPAPETPAQPTPPVLPGVTQPAPIPPKSPKCRKGFKKKRVKGKLRCVKAKKHKTRQ